MTLLIGYATVVATNNSLHWSATLLLILFAIAVVGSLITGIVWLVQWYKKKYMGGGGDENESPRDFEIIWLEESFFLKGPHNDLHSYNSTDEKDKVALILRAKIRVSTFKQINVQSIALKIGSQEFPWDEDDINVFGEPMTDVYQFEFPLSITRGKQIARIKAIVDGKEHILPNHLIIDFPQKSN